MDTFELPENLSEQSVDDLESLRQQALAAFEEAYQVQPRTAESIEQMTQLRDQLQAIDAAAAELADADGQDQDTPPDEDEDEDEEEETTGEMADEPTPSDLDEQAEALADEIRPPDDAAPAEEPADPAPDAASDESVEVAEAAEAPTTATADEPAADEPSQSPQSTDEDTTSSDTQEPAAVAASASSNQPAAPSATALNAHRDPANEPAPTAPATLERDEVQIIAAANLPKNATGERLTFNDMADAIADRIKGFPTGGRPGQLRGPVATIRKPFRDDETVLDGGDPESVLSFVTDEKRLPGGSLVAAAGWCAPSEVSYDLAPQYETTEGILSVPTVSAPRGGIRHTLGPDFRTIYDATGFTYTEADDIAGDYQPDNAESTDKPCVVVPCPDFVEDRLEVAGLCITSPILQNVTYPELLRRFTAGALVGHAHRLNALMVDDMVAGSDAVAPTAFGGSTTSILSALELVATDVRNRHRMGFNASMEVVFPEWARGLIRADLSNRLGIDMLSVSDAMIDAWMRERKVNPQYIYDWQDDLGDAASGFGGAPHQTTWPDTVDFLIYPAGTWVRAEEDIITVDTIYDSVNLPQNMFTALFTEEAWMSMKRGHDSRVVTVTGWNHFGDTNAGTTQP